MVSIGGIMSENFEKELSNVLAIARAQHTEAVGAAQELLRGFCLSRSTIVFSVSPEIVYNLRMILKFTIKQSQELDRADAIALDKFKKELNGRVPSDGEVAELHRMQAAIGENKASRALLYDLAEAYAEQLESCLVTVDARLRPLFDEVGQNV
jgi:hypothetical protein